MSEALPELFERALELDAKGRRAVLDELRSREPALAMELELLLADGEGSSSPLDRSPWEVVAESVGEASALPASVGPYRILRELGRGGMGRVFLAEEETADFKRTVALKVIDRPGFDDDAVRRFRDEVRILSSLEHPGIARFLHGGRAPDGTWFLALEYVDGEDLLTWVRQRDLSLRARIELFVAALDAVRFAHARGVVHRDLKPGHMLIDRTGRPRLLDFGISKLVDPETHQSLALTRTESRALTPAYASPEQFRGEPVTPASDVYSLGTMLYELVAGRRPFEPDQGSAAALERAVLETDPEPPSRAVRRATGGKATSTSTSTSRRRELGRDLDAICLKALRKEVRERYANAGELADDLNRFLDGLPVEARRGGRRYRLGRFLHRHRGSLVTAAAIVLAGTAAFVAWRAERRVAELRPIVPEPLPFPYSNLSALPLDELERRFAAEPANAEAGAGYVLGLLHAHRLDEAKLIVSRLRQIPGEAENALTDYVDGRLAVGLEEPQRALVLYTRSLERAISERRGDLVAQVRSSRGRLLSTLGQHDEARREMELAAKEFELAGDHASLSQSLNDLAIEHLQQGDFVEGAEMLRRGIEEGRRGKVSIRLLLLNLGILETLLGRPDRAVDPLEELVAAQRAEGHAGHLGQALGVLAHVYFDLGRTGDAERAYEEALVLLRREGGAHALRSALEARTLMDIDCVRLERAAASLEELERRAPDAGDYNATAWIARLRALLAATSEDFDAMRREFAKARQLLLENDDTDQAAEVDATEALGEFRAGRPQVAARLADQALSRLPPGELSSEPVAMATILRARLDADAGRLDAARGALAKLEETTAASPSLARRLQFLAARAALAAAEGRSAAARSDLQAAAADATRAGRRLDALELRLDLARLDLAADPSGAARRLREIEREATDLGLEELAARARRAALDAPP